LIEPFTGELKRNWSEPQKVDGGIMRYGFWGRLVEYFTFKTVYGDSTLAFSRVFFESKYTTYAELGIDEKTALQREKPKPVSAQNIVINHLGYYNYDKLMKSPKAIKPIISVILNNEVVNNINKIVAVEENSQAAYHFYNNKLCLKKGCKYDFFAFTMDSTILFYPRSKYAELKDKTTLLQLEFVDISSTIKTAKDIDILLNVAEKKENDFGLK